MMTTTTYFGVACDLSTDDDHGALGAVLATGAKLPRSALRLADKLVAAGETGLSIDGLDVSDLSALERANIGVRTSRLGLMVHLDAAPRVAAWLIPKAKR